MSPPAVSILVIGYGNPGRLDDGLGPALAEALEEFERPGVTVDADYQLTVEDAAAVADHDVVIFVDAAVTGREPFFVERVTPRADLGFTTHDVDPATVLGLARDLFGATARGYTVGIRGYEFNEFGEKLSERARANLEETRRFLTGVLARCDLDALESRCDNNGLLRRNADEADRAKNCSTLLERDPAAAYPLADQTTVNHITAEAKKKAVWPAS